MDWDKVLTLVTAIISAYSATQGAKAAEMNKKLKELELKEKEKDARRGNGKHPK